MTTCQKKTHRKNEERRERMSLIAGFGARLTKSCAASNSWRTTGREAARWKALGT